MVPTTDMMVVEQFDLGLAEDDAPDQDAWSNEEGVELLGKMPEIERYFAFSSLDGGICLWDAALCQVARSYSVGMSCIF